MRLQRYTKKMTLANKSAIFLKISDSCKKNLRFSHNNPLVAELEFAVAELNDDGFGLIDSAADDGFGEFVEDETL